MEEERRSSRQFERNMSKWSLLLLTQLQEMHANSKASCRIMGAELLLARHPACFVEDSRHSAGGAAGGGLAAVGLADS